MNQNQTNQKNGKFNVYFPISMIANFENDPQLVARQILTYAHNKVLQVKGEEASKKISGFDFAKYEEPPKERYTNCDFVFLRKIANGEPIEYDEVALFLFVVSVRWLLGYTKEPKRVTNTNWKRISYLSAGYTRIDETKELNGISKRFMCRTHTFRNKLIKGLERFGIGYYSDNGLRGFEVYQGATKEEVKAVVKIRKIKHVQDEKRAVKEKESVLSLYNSGTLKEIVNSIHGSSIYTDDLGKFLVKSVKNNLVNELEILLQKWFTLPQNVSLF